MQNTYHSRSKLLIGIGAMLKPALTSLRRVPLQWSFFFSYSTVFLISIITLGTIVYTLVKNSIIENLTNELDKTSSSVVDMVRIAATVSTKNYLKTISVSKLKDIELMHSRSKNKSKTELDTKKEVLNFIKNQKIGRSGFIFVSKQGESVSKLLANRKHFKKSDYISLIQANNNRRYTELKLSDSTDIAIYNFDYEPWQWTVSIVVFKKDLPELINIDDFRESVSSLRFAKTGYAFIYNGDCEVLAHPKFPVGKILDKVGPNMQHTLLKMCEEKNGRQRYLWKNPQDDHFLEKIAIYKYIKEYDWIAGASVYVSEISTPLESIRNTIVIVFSITIIFTLLISFRISTKISKKLILAERLKEKNTKLTAIAKTIQMLAHDVRKPFSMLDGVLSIIESISSLSELQKAVKQYIPEVKKALTSVNVMITDVMEVGRTKQLYQKPISPELLIEASLKEVCHIQRKANANIKYHLKHNFMVHVDAVRVQRVFSNIINNAFEAMRANKGTLWFFTKENLASQFTQFCIGNSGSFIKKNETAKIFDAFYTKNKQGGTGLGLAVAQEIIYAHGGKIWCKSSEEKQTVEFYFLLPIAENFPKIYPSILPPNTKSIVEAFGKTPIDKEISENYDSVVQACEKIIIDKSNKRGKAFNLGIVDDKELYRNVLNDLIIRSKNLKKCIEIHHFNDGAAVLKVCEQGLLDILICDVDLGQKSMHGFDIVAAIRKRGNNIPVCIHSNFCSPDHYEQAVAIGAQAFISKPMNRAQILKFITSSI